MANPRFSVSEDVLFINDHGEIKEACITAIVYQGDVGNEYAIAIDGFQDEADIWEDFLFKATETSEVIETAWQIIQERTDSVNEFMRKHGAL